MYIEELVESRDFEIQSVLILPLKGWFQVIKEYDIT